MIHTNEQITKVKIYLWVMRPVTYVMELYGRYLVDREEKDILELVRKNNDRRQYENN